MPKCSTSCRWSKIVALICAVLSGWLCAQLDWRIPVVLGLFYLGTVLWDY